MRHAGRHERARLLLFAVLSVATPDLMAADGKAIYVQKACASCHGEGGKNPLPSYPRLGGQNEAYLVQQMNDIKSGRRNNGLSVIMTRYMATVSEEDIAAIAEYLAAQ